MFNNYRFKSKFILFQAWFLSLFLIVVYSIFVGFLISLSSNLPSYSNTAFFILLLTYLPICLIFIDHGISLYYEKIARLNCIELLKIKEGNYTDEMYQRHNHKR